MNGLVAGIYDAGWWLFLTIRGLRAAAARSFNERQPSTREILAHDSNVTLSTPKNPMKIKPPRDRRQDRPEEPEPPEQVSFAKTVSG
jgi:hypothetical protein